MAILEEEVWVGLTNKHIQYYEGKGYVVPKYSSGSLIRVSQKTKILVKTEDIHQGSKVLVTKICDECGEKIENVKYSEIKQKRRKGDGKDRCFKCARIKGEATKRVNIPYEKSLEYYAKHNNKEFLLAEFSSSNSKRPMEIHFSSNDRYEWKCEKCGSIFDSKVNNRTSNDCNCPYCAGQKVNHTNCLFSTHPEVAKQLTDPSVGFKVTSGSGLKISFTCQECGNVSDKIIKNVVNVGFGCNKCSDGFSYPEKFVINLLSQLNIKFETQKVFNWSMNKRYDFFLPFLNTIIETHGEQHYKSSFYKVGRNLEEEQKNDELKEEFAKEYITNYIVIDCAKSEWEYIKENIEKSFLSLIVNLDKVNWEKCHEYACDSLVKTVSEIWDTTNLTIKEIAGILTLDSSTVRRYLKQGEVIGWCKYSPKENIIRKNRTPQKHNVKSVVQLKENNEFVAEWISIAEASRNNKIQHTGIIMSCKGKLKQSGGYKWMYKEDYEKLLHLV